ncbi:Sec-independent protein translocase protein TatC [Pilimelia anulata]|uniref:Sec-independent protein translocase protein TatC n=1 Tax=Pilimelia anulata TaxID=53371 RepID=A0A8J3BB09_9ACTN|nr:twin-arginine translocase subunit TatC [Pilimelia anulata]GGK01912.1 Sec-independent protein translocase protein TatC [Pilimelia anulata]
MAFVLRRRRADRFARAADGSMTLIEHIRELRDRLFWAALGVVLGLVVGFFLADGAYDLLKQPYCRLPGYTVDGVCQPFFQMSPATGFIIKLKLALWIGLIVSGPVWLYQLWAFVAPGLHRHERKWAYVFVAIAAPLFAGGAALAYAVVEKGLFFLIEAGVTGHDGSRVQLEVESYISFVTTMILLFGVAFEFPLLLLMLNFTGVVSARRLASWWRVIVFLCFAFAAVATPDPGPFGMVLLAGALSLLYFVALGVAFLHDRRRSRREPAAPAVDDDELSPLDDAAREPVAAHPREPIAAPDPVGAPEPVAEPLPTSRRYDETT